MGLIPLIAAVGEPSKVAFYIAGGALAACAVILSLVGISQPTFPGKGERAVMLGSIVMVAIAIGCAIATDK